MTDSNSLEYLLNARITVLGRGAIFPVLIFETNPE
jgi:hypothetical protein